MKNTIKYTVGLALLFISNITHATDGGIFGKEYGDELKNGNIHVDDIAPMIRNIIEFFLSLVGLIAIIFIIIGAYQILFGSLTDDNKKGKNTVIAAITGLALAMLSWFIVKLIFDNLG